MLQVIQVISLHRRDLPPLLAKHPSPSVPSYLMLKLHPASTVPDTGANITVIGWHLDVQHISESCLSYLQHSLNYSWVKHVNRFKVLPLIATTSFSAAKEYFQQEFMLVFKNKLKSAPLMPMLGPPMRIHLKEDAIPSAFPHLFSPSWPRNLLDILSESLPFT